MHNILRFCFVFLFICLTGFLHAQELRYSFKNYTPSDGLPSSEVHKVLQDSRHYMWFATDHGVCRYNGYEFKTYNLSDNSILGLYEDYKKRIWAWSFSGRLFVFEKGKWEDYKWNEKLLKANKHYVIHSIYVNRQEQVFVASTGPSSIKISPNGEINNLTSLSKNIRIKLMETENENYFSFVSSFSFHPTDLRKQDKKGYHVEVTTGRIKKVVFMPGFYLGGERIKAKRLGDDIFFIAKQVLLHIDQKGISRIKRNDFVTYDIEQIEGNFFFATNNGLRIENKKGEILQHYFQGIPIVSVAKDYEGGIWVTSLNKGVFYLNNTHIEHLSENGNILGTKINTLQSLNDSILFVGTDKGDVLLLRPEETIYKLNIGHVSVYSFYRPAANNIVYVGGALKHPITETSIVFFKRQGIRFGEILGNSNFIRRGDTAIVSITSTLSFFSLSKDKYLDLSSVQHFRASTLFSGNKGEILVGNAEGLWRFVNGKLQPYDTTNSLLRKRITGIAELADTCMLLGTRGSGLLFVQKNTVMQLTEEQGIASNYIRKIFVDKKNIWLATNKGISLLQIRSTIPLSFSVTNLSAKDGLLSNEVNDIIEHRGKIVFATNEGVSFIDKDILINKKHVVLPFYLSAISLQNQQSNISELKNIGYKNRNLSVRYEALTYGNPGKVNYRYRLAGFDSAWRYTSNLEIQFNPLPYGTFQLELQAKREFESWENGSEFIRLPIVCTPPFWSTTWFWVLSFMLVLFAVFLFFRNRIKIIKERQKEKEKLQQRIGESEQMALRAQMNPHFIFNSLNSIQQYVIESDVEGSNEFITGFSRLIRQTLEFSSKEWITLEEEISYLTTYLKLEKARMESKFVHEIDIQTNQPVSELELPPLLLQPYVENALRHGIRHLKGVDGLIRLAFYERAGVLECIIEDNGVGRAKAMELKAANPIEYQSRGMSLTAERIALLNEGKERKIEVVIEDLSDDVGRSVGTRVRVLFPVS